MLNVQPFSRLKTFMTIINKWAMYQINYCVLFFAAWGTSLQQCRAQSEATEWECNRKFSI